MTVADLPRSPGVYRVNAVNRQILAARTAATGAVIRGRRLFPVAAALDAGHLEERRLHVADEVLGSGTPFLHLVDPTVLVRQDVLLPDAATHLRHRIVARS